MFSAPHLVLVYSGEGGGDKCREWGERGMWFLLGTEEVHVGFGWVSLSERGHLENLGLGGRIILKRIFKIRPIFRALID